VLVLWDSCEIDKASNRGRGPEDQFAAVAPIVPLSVVGDEESRRDIVAGKRFSAFPLPGEAGNVLEADSFVDLRYIVPVQQSLLLSQRVGAVAPGTLEAFFAHLFAFLTRRRFQEDVHCPACGAAVGLDAVAPRSGA
jgi:hypothetical protein